MTPTIKFLPIFTFCDCSYHVFHGSLPKSEQLKLMSVEFVLGRQQKWIKNLDFTEVQILNSASTVFTIYLPAARNYDQLEAYCFRYCRTG